MEKNVFLSELESETLQKSFKTIFRKVAPYEERFHKPVHEFTAREFIDMFSGEKWSKSATFKSKRYQICFYLDWLEGHKIKTTKYQLISLTENDIPTESRFSCYFYSFEEIKQAYLTVFPEALESQFQLREMLCSVLSMLGLSVEQILALEETNIDAERREIHIGACCLSQIPPVFVEWICKLMRATKYNTKKLSRVFVVSNFVVKRAALAGKRDENYISSLVYQSVTIANKAKRASQWAQKSFLPKDLALSYIYCHLYQYEQESGDVISGKSVFRRGDWLDGKLCEWNGTGIRHLSTKEFFMEDYAQWKQYKEKMG